VQLGARRLVSLVHRGTQVTRLDEVEGPGAELIVDLDAGDPLESRRAARLPDLVALEVVERRSDRRGGAGATRLFLVGTKSRTVLTTSRRTEPNWFTMV
jgi:hypothetical protein